MIHVDDRSIPCYAGLNILFVYYNNFISVFIPKKTGKKKEKKKNGVKRSGHNRTDRTARYTAALERLKGLPFYIAGVLFTARMNE